MNSKNNSHANIPNASNYSTNIPSRLAISVISFAITFAGLQTPISAQTLLEEVIVTAQKREQSLQDVPISVSAFSGEALQESGIKDVFDLQVNAPGLIVDQNQNATTSNFSIRGIGTGGNNFGLESSVGLYVDGVYRSRQSSMINQLVDIKSVDILRGPQGTLFGRNTLSGAVQFKTVEPDFEGTGFVEATLGNYGLRSFSGAKSFTAIDNMLAFRATGFTSKRDGWIDNIATYGEDEIFNKDRWGIRLQALITPNDNLTIRLIADYADLDEACCGSTVLYDNNLTNLNGVTGSDAILEPRGGTLFTRAQRFDNEVAYNINPISRSEDSGFSAQIDWDINDYTVTSITAWRQFESFDEIDADFTDLDALTDKNDAAQESFSQELRITYTGDLLNYVAGAYYFTQDLESVSRLTFGEDTEAIAAVFVGLPPSFATASQFPLGGGFFPAGEYAEDLNEQKHKSWAVFGQFDFNITDALTLTAGLRYSDEDKKLIATYMETSDAAGFNTLDFEATYSRNDVNEHIADERLTGNIKLSWFASDDIMTYISFATGYKAGGTNTDRINPAFEQDFDPETSESFEIGMKAEFPEQNIRLNIAAHMTDVEDLQVGTFNGSGFNIQNAATADTYGTEIELSWLASETLSFKASYALTIAEFGEFEQGNCWGATPFRTGQLDPGSQSNISTDPENPIYVGINDPQFDPSTVAFCNKEGGRLGSVPEQFYLFSARKEFQLADSVSAFVMGEYSFIGDMVLDQSNEPLSKQGGYGLTNLRAGLYFENADAELTFWGRNVFDKNYNGTAFPAVLQRGKVNAYRREPVTFGITFNKKF